jgi:transposase-like protein
LQDFGLIKVENTSLKTRRGKFTKEFKETVTRRVQEGMPLKQVARDHKLNPAVLRQWRDQLLALGKDAFSNEGTRRTFTKEFKEAAVFGVQQGKPVKEVARAFRIHPNLVRRWRDLKLEMGEEAFFDEEPKYKSVVFRLSEDELKTLKARARAAGTSMSEFIRSRVLR